MNKVLVFLLLLLLASTALFAQNALFSTQNGEARFTSEAPLELIKASSKELKGLIDPEKHTFAFSIPIQSFKGFNSPLQEEHFHEKYMETSRFPKATFSGKLIEKVDFSRPGEVEVRAKGMLNIHGVEQERIIRSKLVISEEKLELSSVFTILLAGHNIRIPRMVSQKIAEEIEVEIQAVLVKK